MSVAEGVSDVLTDDQGGLTRNDSMMGFASPKMSLQGTSNPTFPSEPDTPHPEPPSDREFFSSTPAKGKYLQLINTLLHHGDLADYLKKPFVDSLCEDMIAALKTEPSLLELNIDGEDTLVVVGDVHGQFFDTTHHILSQQYDKPEGSPDRRFLFLGDYVDRGPQGVEMIMLLFALKIEYPGRIFLLRGNHEESQTSRIYGFLFEVRSKFNDVSVWAKFNEVFCYLPLAALVTAGEHRFMAVHGGLSPTLAGIEAISGIERTDYGSLLDNASSDIVDGLLWSDPSDLFPRFARNERGCGYLFGTAATSDFCEQNKLDFICRAHQMTLPGYCWTHENKCLTLFSAPHYCNMATNLGAIILVTKDWDLRFIQFSVAPNRPVQAPLPTSIPFFGGVFFGQ